MTLNHFICPSCGHDFYADGAYATCDACHTFFYTSQSRTCQRPAPRQTFEWPAHFTITPTTYPYLWPVIEKVRER